MGILDRFRKKRPTLREDIPKASAWLKEAMASSGYRLDGSVESFRELDRFFEEQMRPGGILDGQVGNKLFAIGCYMGEVFRERLGGTWETDDTDPQGEISIAVRFPDGAVCWPVQRAMKRYQDSEDGLYAYGLMMAEASHDPSSKRV